MKRLTAIGAAAYIAPGDHHLVVDGKHFALRKQSKRCLTVVQRDLRLLVFLRIAREIVEARELSPRFIGVCFRVRRRAGSPFVVSLCHARDGKLGAKKSFGLAFFLLCVASLVSLLLAN